MNLRAKFKQDMEIWRVGQGTAPNFINTETLFDTVKCLFVPKSYSKKYNDTGEVLVIDGVAYIEETDILTTDVVKIDSINYEIVDIKNPNSLSKEFLVSLRVRE